MRAATAPAPTPWLNNNIIKCVYNMQCTKVPHTNLPKNNFLLVSLLLSFSLFRSVFLPSFAYPSFRLAGLQHTKIFDNSKAEQK